MTIVVVHAATAKQMTTPARHGLHAMVLYTGAIRFEDVGSRD